MFFFSLSPSCFLIGFFRIVLWIENEGVIPIQLYNLTKVFLLLFLLIGVAEESTGSGSGTCRRDTRLRNDQFVQGHEACQRLLQPDRRIATRCRVASFFGIYQY